MNIRNFSSLLALALALACGANTVDLDATVMQSSNEPGVLGIVHERVEQIAVDDERLYWFGSRLQDTDARNVSFLHSCQKRNCASTLVTYDAQPTDGSGIFSVNGGQIYWYRLNSGELLACPIAGCSGAPRKLASELTFHVATFDDDRLYFLADGSVVALSLSQPATPQAVASSKENLPEVTMAVDDVYAYWLTTANDRQVLVRTRKDGSSAVESISDDVRQSNAHAFSIATDSTSIYWTNNPLSGSINRCPLSGCTGVSDVIIGPLRSPQKLLIDGSELYYEYEPRPYQYALSVCTLPSCESSKPLIEQLDAPGVLAMDDENLYVATTEQDVSPANPGEDTIARIRRLPKARRELP